MVKTANKDKWRGTNPENAWLQLPPLPLPLEYQIMT